MILLYPTTPATALSCGRQGSVAPIRRIGTAIQEGDGVNRSQACCNDAPRRPHMGHTSDRASVFLTRASSSSSGVSPDHRAPSAVTLVYRRRAVAFAVETIGGIYRLALTDAGTWRGSLASGDRNATQLDRHVPAHPEIIIFPTSPIAFINAALPRTRTPEMAQRESEPVLLYDELARIKQRKITRAQTKTSPGGVHVTNEEREDIADLDAFQKRFSRWMVAHRLSEKIDRMGLDAPSVQRALREIMRDLDITLHDHDEPEGMRR